MYIVASRIQGNAYTNRSHLHYRTTGQLDPQSPSHLHYRAFPALTHQKVDPSVDVSPIWPHVACDGLWWPAMACGGLWWPAVACDGLWWSAQACGGLRWPR